MLSARLQLQEDDALHASVDLPAPSAPVALALVVSPAVGVVTRPRPAHQHASAPEGALAHARVVATPPVCGGQRPLSEAVPV